MTDRITGFTETISGTGTALLLFLETRVPVIQSEIVMPVSRSTAWNDGPTIVGAPIAGITTDDDSARKTSHARRHRSATDHSTTRRSFR